MTYFHTTYVSWLVRATVFWYRIANGQARCQREIKELLKGIPDVIVFIRDIKITVPDDNTLWNRSKEVRSDERSLRSSRSCLVNSYDEFFSNLSTVLYLFVKTCYLNRLKIGKRRTKRGKQCNRMLCYQILNQ